MKNWSKEDEQYCTSSTTKIWEYSFKKKNGATASHTIEMSSKIRKAKPEASRRRLDADCSSQGSHRREKPNDQS